MCFAESQTKHRAPGSHLPSRKGWIYFLVQRICQRFKKLSFKRARSYVTGPCSRNPGLSHTCSILASANTLSAFFLIFSYLFLPAKALVLRSSLCTYFGSRKADGLLLYFWGQVQHLFLRTVCTIRKCFSTSESILHQMVFISPQHTYLFWSWQLSIAKVLYRYTWKLHLDGKKMFQVDVFLCPLSANLPADSTPTHGESSHTGREWPRNPDNKVFSEVNLFCIWNCTVCPFFFIIVREANHIHTSEQFSYSSTYIQVDPQVTFFPSDRRLSARLFYLISLLPVKYLSQKWMFTTNGHDF